MTLGLLLDSAPPTFAASSPKLDIAPFTWKPIGTVRGLRTRVGKEPEPRRVSHLQTLANYGIAGDRHASPYSPRQLLVAGEQAYRRFDLPQASLRENLLVDFATEHLRSGDLLRVGSDVVLWMTFQCEPCSLLERRCPGTLKSIGHQRGMLARVLRGGLIRDADTISLTRTAIPEISDDWQGRVLNVARAIPPGQYIVYRQLAELAGVANAYCRAFPRVLAKLPAEVGARVRSGEASISAKQWDGNGLFEVDGYLLSR